MYAYSSPDYRLLDVTEAFNIAPCYSDFHTEFKRSLDKHATEVAKAVLGAGYAADRNQTYSDLTRAACGA